MADALNVAAEVLPGRLQNQLLSDMLGGTAHPFPADIEETLHRIHAHDPALVNNLDHRYFTGWQAGQDLSAGRAMLRAIATYVSTKQAPQTS